MGRTSTSRGMRRWRATREQLMILEGMFKGGIKSPTPQQVKKITEKLKELGAVETKNVFYWFQNHKAREKQKLRSKFHPLPPLFASPFFPFFPPQMQVIKGQWISSEAPALVTAINNDNNNNEKPQEYYGNGAIKSQWVVTWLPTGSDSDHNNRPLETLQLFPTTAATTETNSHSPSAASMASSRSSMSS